MFRSAAWSSGPYRETRRPTRTLRAGLTFREPLQGAGVKHLGILKPWAPTRSFGLLVRLDDHCPPVDSLHSRANGRSHGVTSAVAHEGRLYVTAKSENVVTVFDSISSTRGAA